MQTRWQLRDTLCPLSAESVKKKCKAFIQLIKSANGSIMAPEKLLVVKKIWQCRRDKFVFFLMILDNRQEQSEPSKTAAGLNSAKERKEFFKKLSETRIPLRETGLPISTVKGMLSLIYSGPCTVAMDSPQYQIQICMERWAFTWAN